MYIIQLRFLNGDVLRNLKCDITKNIGLKISWEGLKGLIKMTFSAILEIFSGGFWMIPPHISYALVTRTMTLNKVKPYST